MIRPGYTAAALAALALGLGSCAVDPYTFTPVACAAPAGGGAAVCINSPTAGDAVEAIRGKVSVHLSTANFRLVSPGTAGCDAASNACGHIHLQVDGAACNFPGEPYNALGPVTEGPPDAVIIEADLTRCAAISGTHVLRAELRHNDHAALSPIAAFSVTIMLP